MYSSGQITILIWGQGGRVWFYGEDGFDRSIHNIENTPFRTKFDSDIHQMRGNLGLGCISDYEAQPLIVRSHHGTYALATVSKINNMDELTEEIIQKGYPLSGNERRRY